MDPLILSAVAVCAFCFSCTIPKVAQALDRFKKRAVRPFAFIFSLQKERRVAEPPEPSEETV